MNSAISIGSKTDLHIFIELQCDEAVNTEYIADSNHQFHIDTHEQLVSCDSVKCVRNIDIFDEIIRQTTPGICHESSKLIRKHLYDYRDYYHTISYCTLKQFESIVRSVTGTVDIPYNTMSNPQSNVWCRSQRYSSDSYTKITSVQHTVEYHDLLLYLHHIERYGCIAMSSIQRQLQASIQIDRHSNVYRWSQQTPCVPLKHTVQQTTHQHHKPVPCIHSSSQSASIPLLYNNTSDVCCDMSCCHSTVYTNRSIEIHRTLCSMIPCDCITVIEQYAQPMYNVRIIFAFDS